MATVDGSFGENLPCMLSDDEIRSKGELLAITLEEIGRIESEFALERKRIRQEVEVRREKAKTLANEVSTKTEVREVSCTKRISESGERIEIVRIDTGEVVRDRPMTNEERQECLFPPVGARSSRLPVYDPGAGEPRSE